MAHKDKVKALIGGGLNAYHQGVKNQINRINKESLKQNHVINVLSQDLTKDYITKTEEGSYIDLDHSKDGMIFLDKIKGKTFINLCDYSVFNDRFENHYYNDRTICETSKLKLNTYYTVVIFKQFNSDHSLNYNVLDFGVGNILNAVNGHPIMNIGDSSVNQYRITYNNNKSEVLVQKIKFQDFKGFKYFSWRPCRRDTAPVVGEFADYNIKIVLLEGDHTQNPPKEYFEGFASVGSEVENIEVKSIKADGNLFDGELELGTINGNTGENSPHTNCIRSKNFINVLGASNISFSSNLNYSPSVSEYDSNFSFIRSADANPSIVLSNKTKYIKFRTSVGKVENDLNCKFMINKGTQPMPYQPYKEDKKPILFKDADGSWKPLTELKGFDVVCDTIELHSDGKYYYHKKTDMLIIDGVNILFTNTQNTSEGNRRVGVVKPFIQNEKSNASSIVAICDKIPSVTFNDRASLGIYVTCNEVLGHNGIWWTNNILENTDTKLLLEEANNYVKSNPLTVMYPLAEEVVFEVDPITLICYANSALLTNTNIAPTITARYSGQAPALVKARKTKALSKVNSVDIEENIVPYLMDMDYRVAILQLNSGQTVAAYKSLGNTFDMLKRDILTNIYSKEEYLNRIEVYLNINRITQEEYEKLGELLNG